MNKYSEESITNDYETKLNNHRKKYALENAKFEVGDFIYNVTGIIKVERLDYEMMFGIPQVIYYGYRYKKLKGKLIRTKNNKISFLRENNLKKILT